MQAHKTTRWLWHADKLFFGAVLVVCAIAAVSFWTEGPRPREIPKLATHAGFDLGAPRVGRINIEPRFPDLSVDIATDPDEYRPRAGEHVCLNPECTYIVPDGALWCPKCLTRQDDRDFDGMDDAFEEHHVATNPDVPDGHLDYDGDHFSNKEEYDGGSDPDDPKSVPAPIRLVAIEQELVDVLFRGYAKPRDGQIVIQLNWGNDTGTSVLSVGAMFRGYHVEEVRAQLVERGSKEHHTNYTETDYSLVLRRPDGEAFELPRNTWVREPERYGLFVSAEDPTRRVRAYAGMRFRIDGHVYVVLEVSADRARLLGDRGEQLVLELRPISR
jgi:hypothetical protein